MLGICRMQQHNSGEDAVAPACMSYKLQCWALPSGQGQRQTQSTCTQNNTARNTQHTCKRHRQPHPAPLSGWSGWRSANGRLLCVGTAQIPPAAGLRQFVPAAPGSSHLPNHQYLGAWVPRPVTPLQLLGEGSHTTYTYQHTGTHAWDPSSNWAETQTAHTYSVSGHLT